MADVVGRDALSDLAVLKARVVTTTAVQKLMVESAIGRRIEITVWRNGALVDVIVEPLELPTR